MLFLKDASNLISPYLKHPDFDRFEVNNGELLKLKEEIKEKMQGVGFHPFGQGFIKLDEETETMFRRYTEICEEGLEL
ncbi:MAG: hypothetical protein U9P50_00645 [Patescibacteria group bacterium]|nr:hypothetical protein [Patescibacteria group bacterium]